MERIIAYCGIVCSECEAYEATQADDAAALEQVVAKWREEYSADITLDAVICDGCLGEEGRKCGHCAECDIRACGVERGVVNCAHCADYACDKLERLFGFAPHIRPVLDEIHQGLGRAASA